jgi:hypothetical protein
LTDNTYAGAEYRFACSDDTGNTLVFQAVQTDTDGDVGLYVAVEDDALYPTSVVLGVEHLNELHAAINAALEAVATNGIRLIEEAAEKAAEEAAREKEKTSREALRRMGLGWALDGPEPS